MPKIIWFPLHNFSEVGGEGSGEGGGLVELSCNTGSKVEMDIFFQFISSEELKTSV